MAINFARFLPTGISLIDHQSNSVVFKDVIVGINGGYSVTEYVRTIDSKTKNELFIDINIADATFKLHELYDSINDRTVCETSDVELAFMTNVRTKNIVWKAPFNDASEVLQ